MSTFTNRDSLRRRPFIIMASAVLLLVGLTMPAGAAPNTDPPSLPEQDAMTIRESLGYRSDLNYIRTVVSSTGTTNSDLGGLALTPAEHVEYQRRQALADQSTQIDTHYADDNSYAGSWIDQKAGGIIVAAFTSPPSTQTESAITAMLPADAVVTYKVVDWSLKQLTAASDKMKHDTSKGLGIIDAGAGLGLMVNGVGVDMMANRSYIRVPVNTSDTDERILIEYYGPTVRVDRADAGQGGGLPMGGNAAMAPSWTPVPGGPRDIRTGLPYGGEWIEGPTTRCTMGYANARSGQTPYFVTAGHCGDNISGNWYQGFDGTRILGQFHGNATVYGGATITCDCTAMGPSPASTSTSKVLIDRNAKYLYTNTGNPPKTGTVLCHAGAASYEDPNHGMGVKNLCGMDLENSSMVQSDNPEEYFFLDDAYRVGVWGEDGDSGAPLGNGPSLLGIFSTYNQGDGFVWFSKATHLNQVGITLAYTGS